MTKKTVGVELTPEEEAAMRALYEACARTQLSEGAAREVQHMMDAIAENEDTSAQSGAEALLSAEVRLELRRLRNETAIIWKARSEAESYAPPGTAEFLVRLFAKPELSDGIIGCREEAFRRHVAEFGRKRAVRFYWADTLKSLPPQFGAWAVRLIKAAVKRLIS